MPKPPQPYHQDPDNEDLHIERPSRLRRVPDGPLANLRAHPVPGWESANPGPFVLGPDLNRDLPARPGTPGQYPIWAIRTAEPRRVHPLQSPTHGEPDGIAPGKDARTDNPVMPMIRMH